MREISKSGGRDIYQDIYYGKLITEEATMMKAKVFENGRSQAVRLPKECRFNDDEVLVSKIGDIVVLMPKGDKWSALMKSLDMFSPDFMDDYLRDKEYK